MDSASQKRKPGSSLTHRACYVWLQRPSPLGFSMPVNEAPFISLWFHGNVQNAQQVAASPGGEGSARGPSCDVWAALGLQHPPLRCLTGGAQSAVGGRLSLSLLNFLPRASHPPWPTLPAAPSLQASAFQLPGHQLHPGLAWERTATGSFSCSAQQIPLPSCPGA